MSTYIYQKIAARKFIKRFALIISVPTLFILVISIFLIYYAGYKEALISVLILYGVAIGVGILSITPRIKKILSIKIKMDEDAISQEIANENSIMIKRVEVSKISEYSRKGMYVVSSDLTKSVFVPIGIEKYDEIQNTLKEWYPIVRQSETSIWTILGWSFVPFIICAIIGLFNLRIAIIVFLATGLISLTYKLVCRVVQRTKSNTYGKK